MTILGMPNNFHRKGLITKETIGNSTGKSTDRQKHWSPYAPFHPKLVFVFSVKYKYKWKFANTNLVMGRSIGWPPYAPFHPKLVFVYIVYKYKYKYK